MEATQLSCITKPNPIILTIKISAILIATLTILHQDLAIIANDALQNES